MKKNIIDPLREYTLIPVTKVTTPPTTSGSCNIIINGYWVTVKCPDTGVDCIIIYRKHSKQYNQNEKIVKMIVSKESYPANEYQFLPTCYFKE